MLFSGLGLPVTSWRLILIQMLPAEWIWALTVDLKAHALSGMQFHDIREPVVLVAARVVGMRTARPAGTAQSGRVAKMPGPSSPAQIG